MNLSQKTVDLIAAAEAFADQANVDPNDDQLYKQWDTAYSKAVAALSEEYLADHQRLTYATAEGQPLLDALCYTFGLRDGPEAPRGQIVSCAGSRLAKAMGRK